MVWGFFGCLFLGVFLWTNQHVLKLQDMSYHSASTPTKKWVAHLNLRSVSNSVSLGILCMYLRSVFHLLAMQMWKLACPEQAGDPYHALLWKSIVETKHPNYSMSSSSFTSFNFDYNSPDVFQRSENSSQPVSSLRFIETDFYPCDYPKWVLLTASKEELHIITNFHCSKTHSQSGWSGKPGGFSPLKRRVLVRLNHALWNLYLISGLIRSTKII